MIQQWHLVFTGAIFVVAYNNDSLPRLNQHKRDAFNRIHRDLSAKIIACLSTKYLTMNELHRYSVNVDDATRSRWQTMADSMSLSLSSFLRLLIREAYQKKWFELNDGRH